MIPNAKGNYEIIAYAFQKFFVKLFFKKVCRVWGAERPVDVRLAPTGAKRRPTSHGLITLF